MYSYYYIYRIMCVTGLSEKWHRTDKCQGPQAPSDHDELIMQLSHETSTVKKPWVYPIDGPV